MNVEVSFMKIADHLSKEQKQKLNKMRNKKFSRRELEDLMGMKRDTYKRHNGAWRRK
jgi:hypothetical protein